MTLFPKYPLRKLLAEFPVQLLCLLFVGILEFLVMSVGIMFEYKAYYLLQYGCLLALCVFWLSTLLQSARRYSPRYLLPSIGMALWFLIAELQHRSHFSGSHVISLFFVIYLMVYPFSAFVQSKVHQKGLCLISGIYIAAALVLLTNSLLLIFGHLPGFLQRNVGWDGTRLQAIHHSNITARIFMLGLAFCLFFFLQAKNKFIKSTLLLSVSLLFIGIALTNSRACVLIVCLLLAGNVFFSIHNGSIKRFLIGSAAAILTAVILFVSANAMFQWNSQRLLNQSTAQPAETYVLSHNPHTYHLQQLSSGVDLPENSEQNEIAILNPQGSWLSDLATLNSRTLIWSEVIRKVQASPEILLWGTGSSEIITETLQVEHTHNSWLEVLLRLGIPGLIFSLYFTWQAVWAALCLLWKNSVSLWKKNIAMLVLCLLITGFIEPTLFFTTETFHAFDFIFFLCLGYMSIWKKELSRKN